MEDFLGKCRICLSIEESEKLTSIYERKEIALKIFVCTQIKIIELCSEGLTAKICHECLEELTIAFNFRRKTLRSEELLRENLKLNEIDILSSLSQKDLDVKLETDEMIKAEPADGTFELIDNIETILGGGYPTFENVNLRSYDDTESQRQNEPSRKKRSKRSVVVNNLTSESSCLVTNPIRTVEEKSNYNCKYCCKVFKHETYLRRHLTRVHSNARITNVKSNHTKCESNKKLNAIRNDENTLYCEICEQFFTTRGSLQKHMKVKHEYVDVKDRYVCDYCGDLFVIKYYLIRHIRVKHLKTQVEKRVVDSPIPCEVCGKILKNRGLLKPHMRSHQVMTPNDYWYCDLCPRKFKTRGGCTWHIQQRHVLKSTFKCPYDNCPVVYKGKWELKCHIKSKHTNQRDFRCEICAKGFLDRQKLQIHTRIHTGERPHACHLCSATFIHQTDLRRHIWGHTGERPIRCEVPNCGKGFMKKSELLNHTNRCHSQPAINLNTQYAM